MSENFEIGDLHNLRETKTVDEQIIDYLNSKGKGHIFALPCTIGDQVYLIEKSLDTSWHFEVVKRTIDCVVIDENLEAAYEFKEQSFIVGRYGENMFLTEQEAIAHLPKQNKYWHCDGNVKFLYSCEHGEATALALISKCHDIWNVSSQFLYGDMGKQFSRNEYSISDVQKIVEKDAYEMYVALAKVYEQSKDELPNEYEYYKDLPRLFLKGDD